MVLLFALVSAELGVTVAGVCVQLQHRRAANSLARSRREDLVLRALRARCLLSANGVCAEQALAT